MSGKELIYMEDALLSGHISGNGKYTEKCQDFFSRMFGFKKCLLTTSCTDALEMSSLLTEIRKDDEVIIPSFTFVSTANAFALRGARIVFADSENDHPNLDATLLESLISPQTKAIVPVHYAGMACDMETIMSVAAKYNIKVIEDAAQSINSFFKSSGGNIMPLGRIGHLSCMSFHETKNIISGEGGMLIINDSQFDERAEIIWEKGTNRSAFFRGEIDKYGWVDLGSSFLPSDLISAFLLAQLEKLNEIQFRRLQIWKLYDSMLRGNVEEFGVSVPKVPDYAIHNAHIYYIVCSHSLQRDQIIEALRKIGVHAVFHYQSLHKSILCNHKNVKLPNAEHFSDCLLRLPLYYDLEQFNVEMICQEIIQTLKSDAKRVSFQ